MQVNHNSNQSTEAQLPQDQQQQPGPASIGVSLGQLQSLLQNFQGGTPQNTQSTAPSGVPGASQAPQAMHGGHSMAQQFDTTQLAQIQSIIQQIQYMIKPQMNMAAGSSQAQGAAGGTQQPGESYQQSSCNDAATVNVSADQKKIVGQNDQSLEATGTNQNLTLNNQAIQSQIAQGQLVQHSEITATQQDHPRQAHNEMYANDINLQKHDNMLNDSQQHLYEGNQPAHNSVLLSNSSQQPQALTGQAPNSSSPPNSSVSPPQNPNAAKMSLNQDMNPQLEQQPGNRSFFELANPQIKSTQFNNDNIQFDGNNLEKEVVNEQSQQHQLGYDQYAANVDQCLENQQEADLGPSTAPAEGQKFQNNQQDQPNSQNQPDSVNLLMNQMQDVIQEGEQAQNELTHYEEELKTYENQYQSITPQQQMQVQEQVTQSVQMLNQQIDSRKMQIQGLQDKYNQLQQKLIQKNEQNTITYNQDHQQQNNYASGLGAGNQFNGHGSQQPSGMTQQNYQTNQPQDTSNKAQDAYNQMTGDNNNNLDIRNQQNYQQMQQITQNIINRGFKTPQTIKESSAQIINQSTPKALVTQSKMFRSQRVCREPEKRVNEYVNQQFIGTNLESVGSQGGFINNYNYQYNNNQNNIGPSNSFNKNQLSLKPEEQINNFLSLNLHQNQLSAQGKGSFISGGGNNSVVDKEQVEGPQGVSQQIQQQVQYQKPTVVIGQHGAPRIQTNQFSNQKTGNMQQQQLLQQQYNNLKNGPPNQFFLQNLQNQHSTSNQMQIQQNFSYMQGQQQMISSHINNNLAPINLSLQNSLHRQESISSNQSNGQITGSHQRVNESSNNPDLQQLLSQIMQQVRASENMIQSSLQKQLSQSAQRVQELDIANKLDQNLQGLYKLNDQELDSALNALQQQHHINQQQENLGRKFIEQLTLQAQTKLKQLRDKNLAILNVNQQNQGANLSQQEQLQEIQTILQQRIARNGQNGLQSSNQNKTGQSTQLAQWLSIQEQASILSKKLIQQNSAAILKSASRMQEQQNSSNTGTGFPINNSALQGGSGSSNYTSGQQVQHFQLTDSINILKQSSYKSQQYDSHNNQNICGSSQKDDHFMNIDDLQQNVIANNKTTDCKMSEADSNQLNGFQKGPQSKTTQKPVGNSHIGSSSAFSGSKTKEAVQTANTLENVIRFKNREYQFYGKGIISDEQAMEIFDKLLKEQKDPAQSLRTLTQWKDDETHLFQYGLFAYMVKNSKFVEDFQDADWEQIAEIVPTKDAKKCHKRWLFIQKQGGNKTKWTNSEDKILKQLILQHGAKDWTNISEKLNEELIEHMVTVLKEDRDKVVITARNGKQCRERWLTALDPSIKKSQWTLQEDQEFLEQWLKLGNKWREIANIIDGRTESQVKNRFKLILRREHIQQTKIDPEQLRNQIIPRIIRNIKQQILQGSDSKSQNAGIDGFDDNEDSDGQIIDSKGKAKAGSASKQINTMQRVQMLDDKNQGSPSIKKKKAEGKKNTTCKQDLDRQEVSQVTEDDQEMDE